MIRIINFIILISIFSGCTQRPEESVNVNTNSKITEVDLMNHIKYLADDKRAGRYPGTVGSKEAVDYIVDHFRDYGLSPAGSNGYLQNFDFITGINLGEKNNFTVDEERYQVNTDFIPLEFSANQKLKADIVIKALGFNPEPLPKLFNYSNLKVTKWGTIKINHETMMTDDEGIFAAGDIVRGASLVVWAIKDGRDAAQGIEKYLYEKRNNLKKSVNY